MVSRAVRVRGFTLIELMISVAIVGILAALAVPAWAAAAAKARQTEAKAGLKGIHTLEVAYFAEHSTFGTLLEIGFVNEGAARYGYMIDDRAGGVVPPDGSVIMDTGGGEIIENLFPNPPPDLPDDDDGGTPLYECTVCNGNDPGGNGQAFGNPHVDADSFEAVALGSISSAPSPHDVDVWTIDQSGILENINPGY